MTGLHADARAILAAWEAPDAAQQALCRSFVEFLDSTPDAMLRSFAPDHLTGSALIVRRDAERGDRVLLVFHSKAGKWLQTGGHCEASDAVLSAAALREAREESGLEGLTVDPVPLRLSRHHVPFCGSPPGGGHHLDVQFLVQAPATGDVVIAEGEDQARWFPLDPAAAPEPTDQDVRDLIAAASSRLRGTP
ncbi:MAG TPA: NUDIX domain-containing protein [Aeromicrobium sp.]|nr:NUDIX domain-containing protein [Aeromicrobium sp.]